MHALWNAFFVTYYYCTGGECLGYDLDVLTAVRRVTPCSSVENWRNFWWTYWLHLVNRRRNQRSKELFTCLTHSFTLKMEAILLSETSVPFFRSMSENSIYIQEFETNIYLVTSYNLTRNLFTCVHHVKVNWVSIVWPINATIAVYF